MSLRQILKRVQAFLGVMGLGLLLSACGQTRPAAPTALPQPQLHVSAQPLPTAVPQTDLPEPTQQPSPFPQTLAEMARLEFGARLMDWIRIPAIEVFAPVAPVGWSPAVDDLEPDETEWDSPDASVGWVLSSALPGDKSGSIILYGHNNIDSSVFRNLADLQSGDEITLSTAERDWVYQVAEVTILPVLDPQEDSQAYREYFKPSRVPRLTLVSCWPPSGNTHRVIVTAYPLLP